MQANFTNEGGYDHRFRYLKNIMGLWMIQSVKKEFEEDLSFSEICERASREHIVSIAIFAFVFTNILNPPVFIYILLSQMTV